MIRFTYNSYDMEKSDFMITYTYHSFESVFLSPLTLFLLSTQSPSLPSCPLSLSRFIYLKDTAMERERSSSTGWLPNSPQWWGWTRLTASRFAIWWQGPKYLDTSISNIRTVAGSLIRTGTTRTGIGVLKGWGCCKQWLNVLDTVMTLTVHSLKQF